MVHFMDKSRVEQWIQVNSLLPSQATQAYHIASTQVYVAPQPGFLSLLHSPSHSLGLLDEPQIPTTCPHITPWETLPFDHITLSRWVHTARLFFKTDCRYCKGVATSTVLAQSGSRSASNWVVFTTEFRPSFFPPSNVPFVLTEPRLHQVTF